LQSEGEHSRKSNGSVRAYHAAVFYCGKVHIPCDFPNFLAVLPLINKEQNEVSLILVQMEPERNTETEGSLGRPVMTDEPNESGAKSVLPHATGTNKRVLHGSIIRDKPDDASLESEVFFHKGTGSPPGVNIPVDFDRESNLANPSGLRVTSFPVPSARKRGKNRSEHVYPT
jgi:hypothetical protein